MEFSNEFNRLVSRSERLSINEYYSQSRREVLKLKEDIAIQQYYDFVNQHADLIREYQQTETLSVADKQAFIEVSTILKLLILKEMNSERDFIYVDTLVNSHYLSSENALFTDSHLLRPGVLPFLDSFKVPNLSPEEYRDENGSVFEGLSIPQESFFRINLDQPIIKRFVSRQNPNIRVNYISVTCLTTYDRMYVPLARLESINNIQLFQHWLNASVSKLDQSNVLSTLRFNREYLLGRVNNCFETGDFFWVRGKIEFLESLMGEQLLERLLNDQRFVPRTNDFRVFARYPQFRQRVFDNYLSGGYWSNLLSFLKGINDVGELPVAESFFNLKIERSSLRIKKTGFLRNLSGFRSIFSKDFLRESIITHNLFDFSDLDVLIKLFTRDELINKSRLIFVEDIYSAIYYIDLINNVLGREFALEVLKYAMNNGKFSLLISYKSKLRNVFGYEYFDFNSLETGLQMLEELTSLDSPNRRQTRRVFEFLRDHKMSSVILRSWVFFEDFVSKSEMRSLVHLELEKGNLTILNDSNIFELAIEGVSRSKLETYLDYLRENSVASYLDCLKHSLKIIYPEQNLDLYRLDQLLYIDWLRLNEGSILDISSELSNIRSVFYEDPTFKRLLRSSYLRLAHNINDEQNHAVLDNMHLDLNSSYNTLIYGESELYTTSFNNLFNFFRAQLNSNLSVVDSNNTEQKPYIVDFLDSVDFVGFRTLIKLVVTFNRLDDFKSLFREVDFDVIMQETLSNIDRSSNSVEQFTIVSEIISALDYKPRLVEQILLSNFNRVQDRENKILYGLLVSCFVNKHSSASQQSLEIAEQYPIETIDMLSMDEMFVQDPENPERQLNVQMHLFFTDDDAVSSFNTFKAQYRNEPGWRIREFDDYIMIEGTLGSKTIRIFANRPVLDDLEAVNQNISSMKGAIGELPVQMLVHRGHSFHVDSSLPHITSNTRFVFLGSCGGYSEISSVLDRSEHAQMLVTRGTGMKAVNNPLIFDMNQEMLRSDRIVWRDFWSRQERSFRRKSPRVRSGFEGYVSPHNNLSIMYLNAFRRLSS